MNLTTLYCYKCDKPGDTRTLVACLRGGCAEYICHDCLHYYEFNICARCNELVTLSSMHGFICNECALLLGNIKEVSEVETLEYRVFENPKKSIADIRRWWKKETTESDKLAMIGDDFLLVETPAHDIRDAIKVLSETAIPWCGPVCVEYTGLVGGKPQEAETAERRLEEAVKYLDKVKSETYSAIRNAKSKTIGCKKCSSQINRKYVPESCTCPACGEILLAATYKKKRENAQKAYEKAYQVAEVYRDKTWPEPKRGSCYLVGGWYVEI